MENAIVKMFEFEGRPFAAFTVDGRPTILAKELGVRLGYSSSGNRISGLIRNEWKDSFIEGKHHRVISGVELADLKVILEANTQYVLGRISHVMVLFEEGINMVALKSDKASAVRFQQFLADKVVPQLVRDGKYIPGRELSAIKKNPLEDLDLFRGQLENSIKLIDTIKKLQGQVANMQENYNFGQLFYASSPDDIYISVYAKMIKFEDGTYLAEKELYRWFYEKKILMKGDTHGNKHNVPYADYSRFFNYDRNLQGEKIPHRPTKITSDGQIFFINTMRQDPDFFKHKHIYIENTRTRDIFRANEDSYF
jgi:prophage antirepressor-like protein